MAPPPKSFKPTVALDRLILTVQGSEPSTPHLVRGWQLAGLAAAIAAIVGLLWLESNAAFVPLVAVVFWFRYRMFAMEHLHDVDDVLQTTLALSPTGLTITGPHGTEHYEPHRIERAKIVSGRRGRTSIAIAIAYPPNLIHINAHLHQPRDLVWLATELSTRFDDAGGEGVQAAAKAMAALRKRGS